MSLNSSMDKVLERRREVEERLSASADMANSELAQLARELSDLRPICDQIELVRRIEAELADALLMVEEAGGIVNEINKFDIKNIDIRASSSAINDKMLEKLVNF